MKTKLLLVSFLLLFTIVYPQDKVIDSLTIRLENTKNKTDKAALLNAISDQYKYSGNTEKMIEFATKALRLSENNLSKIQEGNAYLNLVNANIISSNYREALKYCLAGQVIFENEIGTTISEKKDIKKGLAKAYGSAGIVFSETNNFSKAIEFCLKSVKLYEELKDEQKCATLYNNLGVNYKRQIREPKALEYFFKALKIQEKLKDTNVGVTYTNIANCYMTQNKLSDSFNFFQKAKKSIEANPNPRALGEWYNSMGSYHNIKNEKSEAIVNWNLGIKTLESIDDKFGKSFLYYNLGKFYFDKNELKLALINANKSLELAQQMKATDQISYSEKLLSDIYRKQNKNDLSYYHFEKYSSAKDSILNEENLRESLELSMNYELEKKELLQKEKFEKQDLLKKEDSKRNKIKLLFAGIIGLLLAGFGFLIYNRLQLKKNLTLQKDVAEYEQKALHLQMNPHFVFNCLGSISSFIVQNGTESAVTYLAKFSKLMRLTLEYSQEALIPIDKEIESLQNYLELEQLRFNHRFEFTIHKSDAIEDDMGLPPLLIQPFVENAIIHGLIPKKDFGKIEIEFFIEKEQLLCTIFDNGIGFNKSKEEKEHSVEMHKSMALNITKKRLEMIAAKTAKKAHVKITELSTSEQILGTKVLLTLPIQYL
jgi:tetratricopeptide (TPR) repeat protein